MVEVSLTVGKLDASLALLLTQEHHLIEFPTILLPNGVRAGSIVKIRCERDSETEAQEQKKFQAIQDEILETYGKNLPQAPVLGVKNTTQTSCVLEWGALDLGTASLKSLVLYKDGQKLGPIPNPLNNRTSKVSGLQIDKAFSFQLKMDTTAGMYVSEPIEVTTHKMTDLSGINVCLGDLAANDGFGVEDIQDALKAMGAHYPASNKVQVDTTHYVTTRENKSNPEFVKANDMNIPVIRPEWLKACERERRIVGVRDFYVKDCVLPDIIERNYWKKAPAVPAKEPETEPETAEPEVRPEEPVEQTTEPKEAEAEKSEPVPEPVESKPVESEPVESEPVAPEPAAESESKPDEAEPESDPVESEPVESKAAEEAEFEPYESEPAASEPVESEPVEESVEEPLPIPSVEVSSPSDPAEDLAEDLASVKETGPADGDDAVPVEAVHIESAEPASTEESVDVTAVAEAEPEASTETPTEETSETVEKEKEDSLEEVAL